MSTTTNNINRRNFLTQAGLIAGFSAVGGVVNASALNNSYRHSNIASNSNGEFITITNRPKNGIFSPLSKIDITTSQKGTIKVLDSKGNIYVEKEIETNASIIAGANLGIQYIFLTNKKNQLIDIAVINLDCKTEIKDDTGKYAKLLNNLYYSMTSEWGREASVMPYNGKFYHFFVGWLRDHVHTMKGMKYFYPELKSGIDLYGDSQREDGMIWDNYHKSPGESSYWNQRFSYGNFFKLSDDQKYEFRRIPLENDVEYLFLEGIYYTWKATGDDAWMEEMLDKAIKAYQYSTTDPYRWSEKYQLLKRGFSIDTWDFQNAEDAEISVGEGNIPDPMVIKRGKTRFGVMYGDNTGFAMGCDYLAEMLNYTGRSAEAKKYTTLAKEIRERLNEIAWNGKFFTHHVPEDTTIKRDLGVDLDSQVSLSNAYSLNRRISHAQARAIIETYLNIKEEMPKSSPGEWYTIYPPFEKGFGGHGSKWEYMNGSVISIVAGELAHGAFEHGYEKYGVDILDRVLALSEKYNGYLHCSHRGAAPEKPDTDYTPVSIKAIANADISGTNPTRGVLPWTSEGENDLHEFPTGNQTFFDIPFKIVSPESNGNKVCLGLSGDKGYAEKSSLRINKKAKSIYYLHTTGKNYYAGSITVNYSDGTKVIDHIANGKILNWWFPSVKDSGLKHEKLKVAWTGKNNKCNSVGVSLYGWNNPHPEKTITTLDFESAKDSNKWMVLGVTLSNQEVHFMPDMVSTGIPDNWGAAAVVYALVEGLAGVKDTGVAFDKAILSPRWSASEVNEVTASIKYEASGGYLYYTYKNANGNLSINFTSSSKETELKILLPNEFNVSGVAINDQSLDYKVVDFEGSKYLEASVTGCGAFSLNIS